MACPSQMGYKNGLLHSFMTDGAFDGCIWGTYELQRIIHETQMVEGPIHSEWQNEPHFVHVTSALKLQAHSSLIEH